MIDSISRRFARWAANLTYEALPPDVIDKVKALLLHALAGAVLGAPTEHARGALRMIRAEEGKTEGATILTNGSKATRTGAAFANSILIHSSGLFDSYRMLTHPGPVLIPAALVNAELERKGGRDIIAAIAAGYEFLCRLCDHFIPSTAARGFRPSPLYGTLGAALVTGKLLDLDEDGLVTTIALAANFASGLNEGPRVGTSETMIHEPQAARNGVFAGMLGRAGVVHGADTAIEGDAGFYNAFIGNNNGKLTYTFTDAEPTNVDISSITEDLGMDYRLLTVMFRMYPTAGYNQPVIELMTEMKQLHNIDPDNVTEIVVAMNWIETLYPSPAFPRFSDWNQPRVGSTHYFVAHAAVNGGYPVVGGRTLSPTGERPEEDQRVLSFMHRVKLVPEKGRPMFSPHITVRMKDGTTYTGEYPYARMEWNYNQLVERLQGCLPGYPLGKAGFDALVETVQRMDELTSVDRLLAVTKIS